MKIQKEKGFMSKEYGPMIGCNAAITWIENLKDVDIEIKQRVLARMHYEFDKDIPVPPKFHKGKYGAKYDSYTCGNCGVTLNSFHVVGGHYCWNCGFAIGKVSQFYVDTIC